MKGQEFVVHKTSNREHIEGVHEEIIRVLVKLVEDLRPEIEESTHLTTFMISPQQEDWLWKIDFDCIDQQHTLNRKRAPIYIIS